MPLAEVAAVEVIMEPRVLPALAVRVVVLVAQTLI